MKRLFITLGIIAILGTFSFYACQKSDVTPNSQKEILQDRKGGNGNGHSLVSSTCLVPTGFQAQTQNLCCGQQLCELHWNLVDSVNQYMLTFNHPDGTVEKRPWNTGSFTSYGNTNVTPNGYVSEPEGTTVRLQAFCQKTLFIPYADYAATVNDTTLYSDYTNDQPITY